MALTKHLRVVGPEARSLGEVSTHHSPSPGPGRTFNFVTIENFNSSCQKKKIRRSSLNTCLRAGHKLKKNANSPRQWAID